MRSEYRAESSSMWIFLVCLQLLFFPPVSYSAVPLQSIDCFCSSRRLIASLLARFALVRRCNCSCSYSRQFRFSPSIIYALLLACSASVHRLFLLFLSINRFSSHQFRSSPSITSALLSLMDLGGVRRKMTRKNCERVNAVKTVNGYGFKNIGTP